MKVLIVNTNRERSPLTLAPLGACLVASAAEADGHDVRFLDLCFERGAAAAMEKEAKWTQPDVVGFSIRNLDNCEYTSPHSYLPEIRRIVEACRQSCGARIVLGGPAVSQAPEAIASYLGGGTALAGEGEKAFPALLKAIESGKEAGSTPAHAVDMSMLPDPQLRRWLDLRRYAAFGASLPVQTKRGCAFGCSYCVYPLLEGSRWRLRDPEEIADEVVAGSETGLESGEFVDSVFGVPQEHAVACCEAIARRMSRSGAKRAALTTLDLNPLGCTPEMVGAMNAAGFSSVGITIDSGSDTMLNRLTKGFTVEDIRRAAESLEKLSAVKMWIFLLGGPGETEETVRESVRFMESLPRSDLIFVTQGLRVLPKTALRDALVREGVVDEGNNLLQPTFYHSPHVTPERVREMVVGSKVPTANVVTLADTGHPLAPMVQRLASALGARPPYWRYVPLINRARRVLRV